MELDNQNFPHNLPWVLHDISTSCFVSLDLELSGIPMSPNGQAPKSQSLQERYAENKAAAEKYQILQFGLTICYEDVENRMYVLKPYNINVNPMVERSLDINRDWTFMSWSVEFLLANRFSIDAISRHGVRYLSRSEEVSAVKRSLQRYSQAPMEGVEVKEKDEETRAFLTAARRAIDKWMAQGKKREDYLNFPPSVRPKQKQPGLALPKTLNSMQRWLLHHLVSTEYPSLVSRSRGTFIQIEEANAVRDQKAKDGKLENARQRIQAHIGLRWLVEALIGGDLSGLEPQVFRPLLNKIVDPTITLDQVSERMKARLRERRTVLVGHNCFTDLVFFYQCFLGQLPETVEEFQARIHELFPVLVDTKYLATHDCGYLNPLSSLEDISRNMAKMSQPAVNVDALHARYLYKTSPHEAGYDSMLAAIAFIRLSPLLHRDKKIQNSSRGTLQEIDVGITSVMEVDVDKIFHDRPMGPARDNFRDFFDLDNESSLEEPCDPSLSLAETGAAEITDMVARGELVPRLDAKFWNIYANRLRVFGTVERMLHLGKKTVQEPIRKRA